MSTHILKAYKLSLLIKESGTRRIFNMILDKPEIEDKDITTRSFLGINRVKTSLFGLLKLGLVSRRCIGDYSSGSKIDHAWFVDMNFASFFMIQKIEDQITKVLQKINKLDPSTLCEDSASNSDVWISDFISLATDHLILSIGQNL